MKIAIIGYGKMGKTIERIAQDRGHEIVMKINNQNLDDFTEQNLKDSQTEIAIEFTNPKSAYNNINTCFRAGVKVISGSTGWLDKWDDLIENMYKYDGSIVYASNFSVGVNIFFSINKQLAKLMNVHQEYDVSMTEIHHTAKVDAPSGTAVTLSEGISEHLNKKNGWTDQKSERSKVYIKSIREDPAPGTHEVEYLSEIDEISIKHTAKSRDGFGLGAVLAAEYLKNKTGLHTMNDVLDL